MIALPPSDQPLTFSMTIGVNAAPYFVKWYADQKLPNEDPGAFLVRMIGPSVVDYVASQSRNAAQATFKAAQESINAEVQTIKAGL